MDRTKSNDRTFIRPLLGSHWTHRIFVRPSLDPHRTLIGPSSDPHRTVTDGIGRDLNDQLGP